MVLEKHDFYACCREVAIISDEINLDQQIRIYLKRLHVQLLSSYKPLDSTASKKILKQMLTIEEYYHNIPDLLSCITNIFLLGVPESFVESIGSVSKVHNLKSRNSTPQHLEEELSISLNAPSIAHCDDIVKSALSYMFGGSDWNFVRKARKDQLKTYIVSQGVDNLVRNAKQSKI